jgi:hypothetical protein
MARHASTPTGMELSPTSATWRATQRAASMPASTGEDVAPSARPIRPFPRRSSTPSRQLEEPLWAATPGSASSPRPAGRRHTWSKHASSATVTRKLLLKASNTVARTHPLVVAPSRSRCRSRGGPDSSADWCRRSRSASVQSICFQIRCSGEVQRRRAGMRLDCGRLQLVADSLSGQNRTGGQVQRPPVGQSTESIVQNTESILCREDASLGSKLTAIASAPRAC